jgi:FkbM family methyltransferase
MKDYSQNGEQAIILRYFADHPIVPENRVPFFLDIGAADGVTFSNTRILAERLFWPGLLIEADPDQAGLASVNYLGVPGIEIWNKAFVKRGSPAEITFYATGEFTGTTLPAHRDKWQGHLTGKGAKIEYRQIAVPTCTITDFLKSSFLPPDFINLDVEGTSADLLPELEPLLKWCKLICVEHDEQAERIRGYLWEFGLRTVLFHNGENLIIGR